MALFRRGSIESSQADDTRFLVTTICIGLALLIALFIGLHATRDATSANRTFGVSIVTMGALSAWILRYIETRRQLAAWQSISERLGLNIKVDGFPLRMQVVVSGKYRGRMIWLYSTRCGKEWQRGVRVEIELPQPTKMKLNLWGPYEVEDISPSMLKSNTKRFGGNRLCFFQTNTPRNDSRFVKSSVRHALLDLDHNVMIRLRDDLLVSEQTATLYHPDALIEQINLLSDLARLVTEWSATSANQPAQREAYVTA